ncbi:MAG TPA: M1 family aminopeptidase, partial [Terriglobales bacterium]|nr:M1 family aminopeptidase [Terriglobales bacterium]
ERYAATQFEAADARRAFPCFDEPEFKARFSLTLIIPGDITAISNGALINEHDLADGRREIRFAETPPISSYLVAYLIGPFEATDVEVTPTNVPVRVFLPRGMADKGVFAREAHARSLTYLEEYTAIPYPYVKVDAIGVPDFEAGAMENPGAITYRLTAIAADPERSSTGSLKGIFYTAAHELTHMWWGDLVTMVWWNDLWLNESFATFVGYKAVADLMPEWGMWRDFVATLARPFALDSLVSTHPISFEVLNAQQATERFDVITYWKGAGVVRMIEGFLGAEAFRAGVRTYLNRYRESNATADDFWRELGNASGRDVAAIANAWIKEPGHPLVHISTSQEGDGLRLRLRQERFFADPKAADGKPAQLWPVPLVIKYGTAEGRREQRMLLDQREGEIVLPGARWMFPNGDAAGFYRVALDDHALSQLSPVLQSELAAHERLSVAGNQWALLRAGAVGIEQYFDMLDGYRNEPDRAVLSTITEHLGWLALHAVSEDARPAFERMITDFFQPQLERMGWDPRPGESADERMKRATILGALGGIARDNHVRHKVRELLDRYLEDRNSIDPNMASVVVSIAARDGDGALFERYLMTKRAATHDPEEEQRFLLALAAFERPELIRRTLELSGRDDEVRPQDRTFLLGSMLGRREARLLTWQHVREQWEVMQRTMDPMLMQGMVRALAQLTFAPVAEEVLQFLPPRETPQTRETIAQVIEQLRIDAATVTRLEPALALAVAAKRKAG